MFKSYKYNQSFKKISKKSVYEQEQNMIHDFLASSYENVAFEYTCTREAVNAVNALKKYTKACRQPVNVIQRGNYVLVVKREVKEKKSDG